MFFFYNLKLKNNQSIIQCSVRQNLVSIILNFKWLPLNLNKKIDFDINLSFQKKKKRNRHKT